MTSKYILFTNYLITKYNIGSLIDLQDPLICANYQDLLVNISDSMLEFINTNLMQLIYNDLYDEVQETTYNIYYIQFIEEPNALRLFNINEIAAKDLLYNSIKICQKLVFKFYIPRRSYDKTYIIKDSCNQSINLTINFNKIKSQLNYLNTIVQAEQRSNEWYIFRRSTLTASNIYKIFQSDYSQSQLIIEKSEPIDVNKFKVTNLSSPLHWGQKYEPVSLLYYEHINNTKVSQFGCIPHAKYSYIAASPDGIVCDESSELYGRMVEIKNVVSREINSIPKMEYWIQMQLQMEVCNLNECDFLETKFTEYLNEEEYLEDVSSSCYHGFIMQFYNNGEVYYEYPPFTLNAIHSNEYNSWTNAQLIKNSSKNYVSNIYWKLEVVSCILVLRNNLWFKNALPYIEIFWNNLVVERDSGTYKERLSSKQKLKREHDKIVSDFPSSGCLLK
jgi:putative phage-type endonuclease|uniref:YqaJ viral recombinase domain-containing protein n=1 Tax=viral metagenome TaxID=1070528 RepID=A0A6C0CAM0_9ZZZZ